MWFIILAATAIWSVVLIGAYAASYYWEEITNWFKKIGRSK